METRIMAIKFSDITGGGIPFGNNAGRPANPGTGKLYSNGEEKRLELYTSSGWQNIVSETPGVVSISGNYLQSTGSGTIEITGTNFTTGAIASVIGTNGVEVNANSTTVNSIVSVTAVFSGLSNANEPYDVKVTNTSNLFGLLPDALYVNASPAWTTAAGSLGTFGDSVAISVSATATDSDSTITYSLASGSTLPSGINLNSSTGAISGTLPDIASNTTYTFTINASDGANPAVPRTFSFVSNAAPIWSTSSGSLGTFYEYTSISLTVAAADVSDSITYALASGSTLPTGVTLNSSTGVISGILPDIASNTTYTFTINATDGVNIIPREFSLTSELGITFEYLLAGGGGGGGGGYQGGGGGAGGLLYGTLSKSAGTYNISIGSSGVGAASGTEGTSGGNTSAFNLIAYGGGKGAGEMQSMSLSGSVNAAGGGSAGGRGHPTYQLASATSAVSGQGNIGGSYTNCCVMGGGGGAGSVGADASLVPEKGGNGGSGISSSITGTSQFYSGGGGGASRSGGAGGTGGSGVGGNGGANGNGSSASSYGSGGGGGGSSSGVSNGGSGSSGVLIIAYPSTIPALTISGLTYDQPTRSGYRVYRFTAGSGTITF
jgi:hypothetical protein